MNAPALKIPEATPQRAAWLASLKPGDHIGIVSHLAPSPWLGTFHTNGSVFGVLGNVWHGQMNDNGVLRPASHSNNPIWITPLLREERERLLHEARCAELVRRFLDKAEGWSRLLAPEAVTAINALLDHAEGR